MLILVEHQLWWPHLHHCIDIDDELLLHCFKIHSCQLRSWATSSLDKTHFIQKWLSLVVGDCNMSSIFFFFFFARRLLSAFRTIVVVTTIVMDVVTTYTTSFTYCLNACRTSLLSPVSPLAAVASGSHTSWLATTWLWDCLSHLICACDRCFVFQVWTEVT